MPLYEYQCPTCGRFELIRKFSDEPVTACPTCGAEVQKLFSAPAIQFKGTGWYVTDYAKKSSGGESGKTSGTKDGGGSDSASKESKGSKDSGSKDASSKSSSGDSGGGASSTPAPSSKDTGSSGSGSPK